MGPRIFLVDTNAYRPPDELKAPYEDLLRVTTEGGVITKEEEEFYRRVYERSGLDPTSTFLPPTINPAFCGCSPRQGLNDSAEECELAVFGAVDGLLAKTGLLPTDIDCIVTTCSIYCPTPSMASMVINKYGMRDDVQSWHLGGMGCANGVVSLNLIKDILRSRPNINAILITTEVTTPAYYLGKDRARMVTNVLFRMGAAAVLLSNKRSWLTAGRAKYELEHAVRVHVGQSQDAFTAIHYSPDLQGINGIHLGKNVVTEASRALTKAMWKVGPRILSWGQVAEYIWNLVQRKVFKQQVPAYSPAFTQTVQHFLIHAGGSKVLDGLGKALRLEEYILQPSRAVLHDYGNVSSSTTWYTLGFVETCRGVRKGQQVLQIGVGSGIKCGVNVWKALRDIRDVHSCWAHRLSPEQRQQLAEAGRQMQAARMGGARRLVQRIMQLLGLFMLCFLAWLLLDLLKLVHHEVLYVDKEVQL